MRRILQVHFTFIIFAAWLHRTVHPLSRPQKHFDSQPSTPAADLQNSIFQTRMKPTKTLELWNKQDKHTGDRWRLFSTICEAVAAENVFYPGSYVDIAPSFVFPSVTYFDIDKRTPRFFGDKDGVLDIIAQHEDSPPEPEITFIHGDYTKKADLVDLPDENFDLLVSLYSGFISEHCTQHLKIGGTLLVNSSHGDAAMASIDPRYVLAGVVKSVAKGGGYRVDTKDLASYMIPKGKKQPPVITPEMLHKSGRGIGYTKSPFAYLFTRIS